MSSDMALCFSGLLKVITPTPSVTLCRILPSAWDLSVLLGTSSMERLSVLRGPVSRQWQCTPSPGGRGDAEHAERVSANSIAADQVRRQRMIACLIEERSFLGGGFQELFVLAVDVVAELNG